MIERKDGILVGIGTLIRGFRSGFLANWDLDGGCWCEIVRLESTKHTHKSQDQFEFARNPKVIWSRFRDDFPILDDSWQSCHESPQSELRGHPQTNPILWGMPLATLSYNMPRFFDPTAAYFHSTTRRITGRSTLTMVMGRYGWNTKSCAPWPITGFYNAGNDVVPPLLTVGLRFILLTHPGLGLTRFILMNIVITGQHPELIKQAPGGWNPQSITVTTVIDRGFHRVAIYLYRPTYSCNSEKGWKVVSKPQTNPLPTRCEYKSYENMVLDNLLTISRRPTNQNDVSQLVPFITSAVVMRRPWLWGCFCLVCGFGKPWPAWGTENPPRLLD